MEFLLGNNCFIFNMNTKSVECWNDQGKNRSAKIVRSGWVKVGKPVVCSDLCTWD